jgi:hypothetical protein
MAAARGSTSWTRCIEGSRWVGVPLPQGPAAHEAGSVTTPEQSGEGKTRNVAVGRQRG